LNCLHHVVKSPLLGASSEGAVCIAFAGGRWVVVGMLGFQSAVAQSLAGLGSSRRRDTAAQSGLMQALDSVVYCSISRRRYAHPGIGMPSAFESFAQGA